MRLQTAGLAAAAACLCIGLMPTNAAAQAAPAAGTPDRVGTFTRLHVDFSADAAAEPRTPWRTPTFTATGPAAADRTNAQPPADCNMPVVKADPKIDPQFAKPLPRTDAITYSLRIVPITPCPTDATAKARR